MSRNTCCTSKEIPLVQGMSTDKDSPETSGNVSRFEDTYEALCNVVQTLTCSLCKQLMNNPSTFSTCGHTFCWNCVVSTLEGKRIVSSICPQCKQPGWKNDLQTNHLMMNLIGQLKMMMDQLARVRLAERHTRKRQKEAVPVLEMQKETPNEEEHAEGNHASPTWTGGVHSRIEELKEEVTVIEAVLELCRTMPVSGESEQKISDSKQRELSVVPDSQDESQVSHHLLERSISCKRVLKERSMNHIDAGVKEPQPPKTIRRMWWKAKPRMRDGPITMVLDMDSFENPVHVQELVDTFASKFADKVSIETEITKHTTHVVVGTDSALVARATPRFLQACTVGCWVVSFLWIDASNHDGSIVEEKNYQVHGHRMSGQQSIHWSLPENSRLRCMAGKRGIFDGMTFIIRSLDINKDLVHLIQLADGKVLESPPETGSGETRYIGILPSGSPASQSPCEYTLDEKWVYDCIGSGKILSKDQYIV